jgi:hypothetical protein
MRAGSGTFAPTHVPQTPACRLRDPLRPLIWRVREGGWRAVVVRERLINAEAMCRILLVGPVA